METKKKDNKERIEILEKAFAELLIILTKEGKISPNDARHVKNILQGENDE